MKTTNYITNLLELSNNKIDLRSKPQFLDFFITKECNLKCIMCCNDFKERDKILNYETISKILLSNKQLRVVEWIGGEPLTHPDIERIMDLAHSLQIRQILVTNGTLLNTKIIKKLIEYNVDITISIHGSQEEICKDIEEGIDFKKLEDNIKELTDLKKQTKHHPELLTINYVVLKQNYRYMNSMIDFLNKYGIKNILFKYDIVNSQNSVLSDGGIMNELPAIFEDILKKASALGINVFIDNKFIPQTSKEKKVLKEDESFCIVPWIGVSIDTNGNVKNTPFCGQILGNIFEDDFDKIWNSDTAVAIRRNLTGKKNVQQCSMCEGLHTLTKTYRALDRFMKVIVRNY